MFRLWTSIFKFNQLKSKTNIGIQQNKYDEIWCEQTHPSSNAAGSQRPKACSAGRTFWSRPLLLLPFRKLIGPQRRIRRFGESPRASSSPVSSEVPFRRDTYHTTCSNPRHHLWWGNQRSDPCLPHSLWKCPYGDLIHLHSIYFQDRPSICYKSV